MDLSERPFKVWVGDPDAAAPTYLARSVIVATGASALMLGLESERRLLGHGLSTCATCDGFFFRDQDIVVVGDSQVFGLGVEEDETFSAKLQALVGRDSVVVNAGIPTYGPPEYDRVAEDLLKRRKAKTLVYVVNLANDLLEADRANVDRHAVWDGWVSAGNTPARATVEAALATPDYKVEIMVVAAK